jgi:TatD DNase family protein
MIDAHCHLYSDKYDNDLENVIQRAKKCLSAVVISAVDSESFEKSLIMRRLHPDFVYVTAGIHPRKTAELSNENRRQLWQAISRSRDEIVAVGEVGPDFYHVRDPSKRRQQLLVLEEALSKAEQWGLPLVIHARSAEEAALEVVSQSRIPVMFHCFAGSREIARKITANGFYISFSAILLASPELQKTAASIPQELILTETDSPALSPLPDKTRNEPVFVEKIVSCLAKQLKCTLELAAKITEENARRFYGLPNRPEA